jgi:hypothetical protein
MSDAANAAYIKGLCVDCRIQLYSPGRVRCEDCHTRWCETVFIPVDAIGVDDIYSREFCTGPNCQRDRKTNRFRVRHDSGLCEFCTAVAKRQAPQEYAAAVRR